MSVSAFIRTIRPLRSSAGIDGQNDGEALSSIPVEKLNSGSSEIRNWITVAGAAAHLKSDWQEVLLYRAIAQRPGPAVAWDSLFGNSGTWLSIS